MLRLVEATRVAWSLLPESLQPLYLAITTLGSPGFIVFLLAIGYFTANRREDSLRLSSYVFIGFSVIVFLKQLLAFPRPREALRLINTGGYGFPSGHALAATVFYGSLASEFDWSSGRKLAGVALIVASVAASRIALRVHYLGDVIAGVLIGLLVLYFSKVWIRENILKGFVSATLISGLGVALSPGSLKALGVFGASFCISLFTYLKDNSENDYPGRMRDRT